MDVASEKVEEEWLREEEKLKEQEKNVSASLLFYDTKKEHFPHLLFHILFLLKNIRIYLEVLVLREIMLSIIESFAVSN